MKKISILLVLLVIAIAAGAAAWLIYLFTQKDSYVLIGFDNMVFTTSVGFSLMVIALLLVVTYITYKLLKLVTGFFQWRKRHRQKHAALQIKSALIALAEGNWQHAERQFGLVVDNDGGQLLGYLGAARAANALGNNDKRDDYLRLADQNTDGADIAVGITKAELQMDRGQLEQALATLMHLRTLAPTHVYIIEMMKTAYVKLSDWGHLVSLIPELRKYKIASPAELDQLECQARGELLKRIVKAKTADLESSVRDGLSNSLISQWESRSKGLQGEIELFTVFLQCQQQIGADHVAEQELRGLLPKFWNDELVNLYGLLKGADVKAQLLTAQGWLQERPNHEMLLLALGRLSMRNDQLAEAKNYFESSLNIRKSGEAYGELGRVLAQEGNQEASNEQFMLSLAMHAQLIALVDLTAENAEAFKKKSLVSDQESERSLALENS